MKQHGFTLAEVLITLTIIGVIAAITIPNLMQKWRKHERITQIKTAHAIIQNAVKMSIAENGPVDSWGATSSCDMAERFIFPYLKLQYECGGGINQAGAKYLRDGCFIDNNNGGSWYWLNDTLSTGDTGYGADRFCKAKLQNGMDFGVWWSSYTNNATFQNSWPGLHRFVFDVNGSQGPTKMGVDVFAFQLGNKTGVVSAMSTWGANNNKITDILNTTTDHGGCNTKNTRTAGFACARVLELNSWEFPNNYPVKKF